MKKTSTIYEEKRILTAKFYHPKSEDYLDYISTIRIKDSGKNPVEMVLKFDGIPPYAAPMPPEEHIMNLVRAKAKKRRDEVRGGEVKPRKSR